MKLLSRWYFVLFILVIACRNDEDEVNLVIDEQRQEIEAFLESIGNDSTTRITAGSGELIYYYPIAISQNPDAETQSSGNVISFLYSLSLLDGTQVVPFSVSDTVLYKSNANSLFPIGLDQGIIESTMRVGDRFGIIMTSGLGLGEIEVDGLIPPNSVLHFHVELTDVSTEQEIFEAEQEAINDYIEREQLNNTDINPLDPVERFPSNGISYKRISAGSEPISPVNGSAVAITYELRTLGGNFIQNVSNNDPFQFVVGSTNAQNEFTVIPGLNFAVQQMEVGERALFIIPSNLAYLESAQIVPDFITSQLIEERIVPAYAGSVEPYSTLVYDIILRGINE